MRDAVALWLCRASASTEENWADTAKETSVFLQRCIRASYGLTDMVDEFENTKLIEPALTAAQATSEEKFREIRPWVVSERSLTAAANKGATGPNGLVDVSMMPCCDNALNLALDAKKLTSWPVNTRW